MIFFFFQAEDGIRNLVRSRGLGDVYKRQDLAQHDRLVALVQQMLDLHRRAATEANPQLKTVVQRQIDATDKQIDRLVYGLSLIHI